jgi:hypothetical protein
MEVNSPNKINARNARNTRKRPLNNKPVPNAKRARTIRSIRFSGRNNIRNINREGRGAPVIRASTTGRPLPIVYPRTNEQKKRAENVAWLSANVSSRHDRYNDMVENAIRVGAVKGLSRNTVEETISHLHKIYSKYKWNYNRL